MFQFQRLRDFSSCIKITKPTAIIKAEKPVTNGQGLGSTKWYGCFWSSLINYLTYMVYEIVISLKSLINLSSLIEGSIKKETGILLVL